MKYNKKSIFLVIFIIFLFRVFLIRPTYSDENFYFNAARYFSEGNLPYKDFFFAHPPFQLFLLFIFFKIFGYSFFLVKLFYLLISFSALLFIYLISKKLSKNKISEISIIFFLFTPTFLAFSGQGYGMWESLLFILAAIYFILDQKIELSTIFFSISIFFRYISISYLPIFFFIIYLKNQKMSKFMFNFFLSSVILFFIIYSLYGYDFVKDTVNFQIFSKLQTNITILSPYQFWSIEFFVLFLALIALFWSYLRKKYIFLIFSLYPIIFDIFLFLTLNRASYHYSLLSLPFVIIAVSETFVDTKLKELRFFIICIIVLSIISNYKTIEFYINPYYSKDYRTALFYIYDHTDDSDLIFGEPSMTNYLSFVTERKIAGNYLDSFIDHLYFEGIDDVISHLEENKPYVFIDMMGYYTSSGFSDFVSRNYMLSDELVGMPEYSIYILREN